KNKLAVAGMKAMNRIKRINHGLPSALLIYPSHDKDCKAKIALHVNKNRIHSNGEERKAGS
ncbi:MAG: hypothetical protein OEW45_12640, partial [Deltaproteobacteria bacterium]|nr:hypothetical protein [Deltaproteobacteria bacterium]